MDNLINSLFLNESGRFFLTVSPIIMIIVASISMSCLLNLSDRLYLFPSEENMSEENDGENSGLENMEAEIDNVISYVRKHVEMGFRINALIMVWQGILLILTFIALVTVCVSSMGLHIEPFIARLQLIACPMVAAIGGMGFFFMHDALITSKQIFNIRVRFYPLRSFVEFTLSSLLTAVFLFVPSCALFFIANHFIQISL